MMNCQDIKSHLADYLGEELGAGQRVSFESHLAACSTCRDDVHALGGTVGVLRSLPAVSAEDARAQTADLIIMRRPPVMRRVVFASLKTAAMIGFGVMLGWVSFGRGMDTPPSPGGGVGGPPVVQRDGVERGVHPDWYKRGRRVASVRSSFARHLAMIAPR